MIWILFSFTAIKSQNFNIEYNKILINNIPFDSTSLIDDYIKVLGQPSRVYNGVNNIYVFDSLGIYIYENYKKNNKIIELSFDFKRNKEFKFSPKKIFRGIIYLSEYHCELNKYTSLKKIMKFCKVNENTSLQLVFGDADFNYGTFILLFEHNLFLTRTKNFTIDFK